MTNPEFGTTSGVTHLDADGNAGRTSTVPNRDDFWVSTPSKQLNFVQHIKTILDIDGRAAAKASKTGKLGFVGATPLGSRRPFRRRPQSRHRCVRVLRAVG